MHDIYKLSDKVINIIMPLAKMELYQSSFYNRVGAISNNLGYLEAEKYFYNESNEEKEHFDMWKEYVLGRGNDFEIPAIDSPEAAGNTLYDLAELALAMEAEVSTMYQEAAADVFPICQMTYRKMQEFIKIQEDAMKFYVDACTVLAKLDKAGELVVEKRVFKV